MGMSFAFLRKETTAPRRALVKSYSRLMVFFILVYPFRASNQCHLAFKVWLLLRVQLQPDSASNRDSL